MSRKILADAIIGPVGRLTADSGIGVLKPPNEGFFLLVFQFCGICLCFFCVYGNKYGSNGELEEEGGELGGWVGVILETQKEFLPKDVWLKGP